MTIETYNQAKFLQDKLTHLSIKKLQVEKMRKRTDDEEFNNLRELAHDAICYAISKLERDFNNL